jgi:hypothetical protein
MGRDSWESDLVEVELHSTDPVAVAATRATLQALPGGGAGLIERGGRFFVQNGFPAFACERQGYVKRVIREAEPADWFGVVDHHAGRGQFVLWGVGRSEADARRDATASQRAVAHVATNHQCIVKLTERQVDLFVDRGVDDAVALNISLV